jgi:hypothetical protein
MHVDAVAALAVSSDGSRLLSADTKGNVWAWNIATRARLDAPRLETGAGRGTLNFSHDGRSRRGGPARRASGRRAKEIRGRRHPAAEFQSGRERPLDGS